MNYFKILLLFLSICLSGCVIHPANTTSKEQNTSFILIERDNIKELLSFNRAYVGSDQVNQKKRFLEIKSESIKNPKNTMLKIKLATMLSLPTSHMKDELAAKDVLEELINNKSLAQSELAYIETLHAFTLESIRQQQQTKDESKKSEQLLQKNELLLQKNESIQRQYDALEKKLTDLKNIERKLIERDTK